MEPPVVDARGFLGPTGELPPGEVARQVAAAAQSHGFFQLVNHGLSAELLAQLQDAMHSFFALPEAEKQKVKRTSTNPYGWFNDEFTKQTLDLKEGFDCVNEAAGAGLDVPGFVQPNQWPEGQPGFKASMLRCLDELAAASFRVLEALAIGLGLPPHTLRPYFEGTHTSFLRLNYYPPSPPAASNTSAGAQGGPALGINHHTDAGFLTILVQDPEVAGLEVLGADGQWHLVTPIPGALTINVGDQAQVLTNDLIKAPLHRVRSPAGAKPRYSAPFFFNPRPDALIAPLPGVVSKERPAAYKPILWQEFRAARFAGDYADLGEEVQISHYRIQPAAA